MTIPHATAGPVPTHTVIDPATLDAAAAYRLLTGIVVPRPIAWITSVGRSGHVNLAPFSAFTMVANDPPMVGVNIGLRAGVPKDTARNIAETGEYVVHVAVWADRETVHESSRAHGYEVDEAGELGLATVPGDLVAVPRLADAPVALECRLSQQVEFGRAGALFTVGEVVRLHVRTDLLQHGNKIDTVALDPLMRLAGPTYARIGTTETLAPIGGAVSSRHELQERG
ncbi:flavin reductase family protein [Modestobacter sp. VKM Ac-2978]|uniref:flavin reductase family protein n=1 Tax=Modestobacter sp. VKM Ac-2978 TaxID=3004132 RepID=UPI0022AA8E23|nr:flavin reductase family protein [Modestobacter sp. VKM Ac-2978]MCZ2847809.1 flavin reductase family protein [Modestobacter sp. VKM Ac-2978]